MYITYLYAIIFALSIILALSLMVISICSNHLFNYHLKLHEVLIVFVLPLFLTLLVLLAGVIPHTHVINYEPSIPFLEVSIPTLIFISAVKRFKTSRARYIFTTVCALLAIYLSQSFIYLNGKNHTSSKSFTVGLSHAVLKSRLKNAKKELDKCLAVDGVSKIEDFANKLRENSQFIHVDRVEKEWYTFFTQLYLVKSYKATLRVKNENNMYDIQVERVAD